MEKQRIYADGVESLTMLEGMVRLDLFCYGAGGAQGKAARQVTGQLVLPPAAFLRLYGAMGELVRRLEEGGVVKRRGDAPAVPAAPATQADAPPANPSPNTSPNASPNFE